MFCDRLLAAGGVVLLLSGCGAKGPPRPPLSREPGTVRDLNVRQAGSAIELRWSRPRARANGDPIQGLLTFRVLARNLERTPVPAAPAATTGGPSAAPGASGPAGAEAAPGSAATAPGSSSATAAATGSTPPASPLGSGGPSPTAAARADEDAFLRDSEVVAEIHETPEQAAAGGSKAAKSEKGTKEKSAEEGKKQKGAAEAGAAGPGATGAAARPPETQYSVLLGPERFPGVRFTSVRLAFAIVAEDAHGRRSHARPILEIDPVEMLPPPTELHANGTPEGIALSWRLPALPPGPSATTAGTPPAASDTRGVDIYRIEAPAGVKISASAAPVASTAPAPSSAASAAPPRFPYRPIAGSPFAGENAVDRTAIIGTSYLYEARLVSLAPGKGLRESASSGTVAVTFSDVFPPGPPTLVTALPGVGEGAPSVRLGWSSPIDAEVAGYRVYRAEGDGAFVLAATVPAGQVEWTDSDVKPGGRYRYTVATIDAAVPPNESVRSEEAEAILPPGGGS